VSNKFLELRTSPPRTQKKNLWVHTDAGMLLPPLREVALCPVALQRPETSLSEEK
jgi:hypothetical protein